MRQRKGESVAANFKRACPDYIPTRANYEAVVETLAFNALSAADQEGTIDEQVAALIDLDSGPKKSDRDLQRAQRRRDA